MTNHTHINRTPFPRVPRSEPRPPVSIRLPGSPPPTQLGRGSAGPEVEALQKNLKALGYPVEVDGKFGPETEAAVKKYQKDHGLDADGIVGPLTHASVASEVGKLILQPRKPPPTPRIHDDLFERGAQK